MLDIVFDRNCVYQTAYHVVWCPKYRKPVLTGTIPAFVQNQIQEICLKHDYRLLSLEIQPDHIHLFISFSPALSIATVVKILKGSLARKLGSIRNFVSEGVSGRMVKSHPFVFSDTGFTVIASRATPLHALLDA